MADPTVDTAGVLSNSLTWINIGALILVLGYQVVMKYFDYQAKKDDDAVTQKLTDAITNLLLIAGSKVKTDEQFQNEMTGTMEAVRSMMKEILDRNSGVMNRDNSFRIVDQSFASAIRDIVTIFVNSLETNGYDGREEFIRNRVKTTIGQTLDNLRASLGYFQMSIDISPFFRSEATEKQGERYVLANQLWELIEPYYRSPRPIKDRVEEVRLHIPNRIRDYLAETRNMILKDVEPAPHKYISHDDIPALPRH